jgi:hypothetical protein
MIPCTASGPDKETKVRAISPIMPTVPPPNTSEMFCDAMTWARERAAAMCANCKVSFG